MTNESVFEFNDESCSDGWSHFDETLKDPMPTVSLADAAESFFETPSPSMKRVSSCYFSIRSSSTDSLVGLLPPFWEEEEELENRDLLVYHDVLMHVFTFLDTDSLKSFSETARRPNFEVFYFLQLQLQNSLRLSTPKDSDGCRCLARLAELDRLEADATVQEFLDSNSTLTRHSLPLSFYRDLLMQQANNNKNAAALALFIAFLGGAAALTSNAPEIPLEELTMFFKGVGFVGSLMGAATAKRTMSGDMQTGHWTSFSAPGTDGDAEHFFSPARMMQAAYRRALALRNHQPASSEQREASETSENTQSDDMLWQITTPNPYEHIIVCTQEEGEASPTAKKEAAARLPSGCVGAYLRALQRARACVRQNILQHRKARFEKLPSERRSEVGTAFIDAACSDNLKTIQDLIHTVDVNAFYVGSDGTETCALHAAALFSSVRTLAFLCRGLAEDHDGAGDGGLCNVNVQDSNGWTALHFAAGANSVQAVQILASCCANLSVEAANGYTPLQWALRLQNEEVAEALRRLGSSSSSFWTSGQPLSEIASRFLLSMIPSH